MIRRWTSRRGPSLAHFGLFLPGPGRITTAVMFTPSQRVNGWMRFWLRKERTCRWKVKSFLLVTSLLTATGCQVTPVGPITSMKSYEKYVQARIDPLWQHLARENESRLAKGTARFAFETPLTAAAGTSKRSQTLGIAFWPRLPREQSWRQYFRRSRQG